ncbi:MAG: DUF6340 family protein [Bacteroidales bacterium]|nr:DUF6340 family protein [Bacteroidales bacterium]
MKKASVILLSGMFMLAACAPQALLVESEMRGPSASGLNLARKTMGIVYLYGPDPRDSSFNRAFSSGFASALEHDYFNGEQVIDLYSIEYEKGTDYTQKDSMVNLAMDVDKDVIFLVDKPSFGNVSFGSPIKNASVGIHSADSSYISAAKLPFNVKVYVYDTQNKEDKVFGFAGDRDLAVDVYSNGKATAEEMNRRLWNSTESAAESAGQVAAKSFVSTWHQDQFFVIYYDAAESAWTNGAEHANSFKWKEAIDDWLPLTKNNNKEKRACAAYNIGLACFMLGQPELAKEWLDRSDSEEPVSLSASLRKQIESYTGVK